MKNKNQGMSWWRKISLVFLLTLMTSIFDINGWLTPNSAVAAIGTLSDWTMVTSSNTTTALTTAGVTTSTTAYTVPSGSNRMLVVAVGAGLSATNAVTCTVTYGGQTMLAAGGNTTTMGTTATQSRAGLFYLNDAGISAATGTNIVVRLTSTANVNMYTYAVHAASYNEVDQTASPITNSQGVNITTAATAVGPFGTGLTVGSGDKVVELVHLYRTGSTTPRTITWNASWSLAFGPTTVANTNASNFYMGTTTTSGSTSQHTASNTTLSSMVAISIKPQTLPTVGTVSVNPKVGGYTSGSPTISAPVSSNLTLTGCEYTINGSTWSAGSVSGTLPNYTCTATPTGLSGSLTINIRATNASGTVTGSAVSITADSTAPADGTLTVLPGNPNNGLFWGAATDGTGSGLNHYDVYFQTGASAPVCGSGTLIYTGTNRNYIHSGLPASTQYSYRVCATDNIGLVSTGSTSTVTTSARPSVINTCNGCHGYAPVDNAIRVGGTTGQFQGSHDQHAGTAAGQSGYACTKCHTDNTTLGHANGNIDMALNPGSYSRGTAPAVANSFTPGNCSNTYCHSNGTGGLSGDTRSIVANTSPNWGGTTTCTTCHAKPPAYTGYTGTVTVNGSKANAHQGATHASKTCDFCHTSVATSDGGATYTTNSQHADGAYSINPSFGYTYDSRRGGTCATPGCHGSVNWGGKLGCVDCHSQSYIRTQGTIGATLAAVTTEFGLAFGHKKSGRGAVTDDDCIVCHLEGNGTTHKTSSYHQNGTIDLRDPQGAGETIIKDFSGANFAFRRFSTPATRSTARNSTDIAQVVSLQFCMMCHKKEGATNPTARSGAGTALSPWGASTGYAANNNIGVPVANGTINVYSQFSSGNSSYHPVRSPLNRDFPIASRLVAPYNNQGAGRVAAGHTKSLSVMMNCFDCHNSTGWTYKYRTNAAHGTNAARMTIGTFYAAAPTACAMCHSGYTSASNHSSGSAMNGASNDNEGFGTACNNCHSSTGLGGSPPARPIPAADFHGYNALVGGTIAGNRPFAFIRSWGTTTTYLRPYSASDVTQGTASCTGGGACPANGNVGDGSSRTYTPGGAY